MDVIKPPMQRAPRVRVIFGARGGGEVNRPELEVDAHSPSGVKVKKEGSYMPTSSHRESLQGVKGHLYLQFSE
jgi:hypothetical protein